jgi:hypothetical protein
MHRHERANSLHKLEEKTQISNYKMAVFWVVAARLLQQGPLKRW